LENQVIESFGSNITKGPKEDEQNRLKHTRLIVLERKNLYANNGTKM
jgi:hypothetical protein